LMRLNSFVRIDTYLPNPSFLDTSFLSLPWVPQITDANVDEILCVPFTVFHKHQLSDNVR
jgi:hypothetical protein